VTASEKDQFSEQEMAQRDALLRRLLKSPPQQRPKRERPKQEKRTAGKGRARLGKSRS